MPTAKKSPVADNVLVTGASSGIGLEIAREFARRGYSLVLVAPVAAELQATAHAIQSEFGVTTRTFAKDLSIPDAAEEISDQLESSGVKVDILVNNAGVGFRGHFWEQPLEHDLAMMRVNVEAVIRLTKYFLPAMVARGHGRILNTASVAGFEPGPMLAVYHATKAFVLSWSEALATELKDRGVTVTALCPGPVDTDFFIKADMIDTRAFQQGNVMGPREVAVAGVEAALAGERVIVPGAINKVSVFSRRLLGESAQSKKNESFYEEVPPEKQTRERGDIAAKEVSP